jgi:hypothetical protein
MSLKRATTWRYRRDGYVVIPGVLDQTTVAACIEHLQDLQSGDHPAAPVVTAHPAGDAFLARISDDPRLTAVAGGILEAEPVPFGCTYFVKVPRVGLPVLWHQDGYPWRTGLGISEAVTLWVALDPAAGDNGGLQVIPGSHGLDAQPLRPNPDRASVFGAEMASDLVDTTLVRQLTLAPGDVSAHHPNLIHGSLPNRSERPRRALAVRYRRV